MMITVKITTQDHMNVMRRRQKDKLNWHVDVYYQWSQALLVQKVKQWKLQMTPCSEGEVNGIRTVVLRDTESTTCVVKTALVKPEQMTGTYELCMLIDGVIKRYPAGCGGTQDTILHRNSKSIVHGESSARHHYRECVRCTWS